MKIFVKAKPNARENSIVKTGETEFNVSVKEPPVGGKANEAIIKFLADYFKIPKSQVKITSGFASRNKTITIGK